MTTILVMTILAGADTLLFVERRKSLLRELTELSANAEEPEA